MNHDEEHYLNLLSTFHYVVASLLAFFACIPLIHLGIGILFLAAPETIFDGAPPQMLRMIIGLMFTLIPAVIILSGWTLTVLTIYSGRCLAQRRRHTFCLVIAGVLCLFMPFGTVLGVLTIIVLLRPAVKTAFDKA